MTHQEEQLKLLVELANQVYKAEQRAKDHAKLLGDTATTPADAQREAVLLQMTQESADLLRSQYETLKQYLTFLMRISAN
jgi:CTP-dependent riboflavin kinase